MQTLVVRCLRARLLGRYNALEPTYGDPVTSGASVQEWDHGEREREDLVLVCVHARRSTIPGPFWGDENDGKRSIVFVMGTWPIPIANLEDVKPTRRWPRAARRTRAARRPQS